MSQYVTSPFGLAPALLLPGKPEYSWGSFNDHNPTTQLFVQKSAIASNVATLNVSIWQGPIPVVGQLISTQSLTNIPNVTNVALTGVTISATTGVGTVSYALTHADVAQAKDAGVCLVPQSIALEAAPSSASAVAGLAVVLQAIQGNNSRSIAWGTILSGGTVSACEFDLQGAINNIDSEFATLDKSTATGGETRIFTPTSQVNFLRIVANVTYSGSPVVVPKIAAFMGI
jgi:hypothetical protein